MDCADSAAPEAGNPSLYRNGGPTLIAGDVEFRTGDRVGCLRNQRADGLLNGLRGAGTALDPDAQSLTARLTDGTDRVVPTSYLDAGHLGHGYAITIHEAQGLITDEALVLATDDLYQEAGYTALSRARVEPRVYAVADDFDDDPGIDLSHAWPDRGTRSLDSSLSYSLSRSRSGRLAHHR